MEDKILNNSYNSVEFGNDNSSIAISPLIVDQYPECTSENMENLYVFNEMRDLLYNLYLNSDYYEKYGCSDSGEPRKVERADIMDIYYTFKDKLKKENKYNIVQIFIAICEFFDFNYKNVYNEILTLEDKALILSTLEKEYGVEKQFTKAKKLF